MANLPPFPLLRLPCFLTSPFSWEIVRRACHPGPADPSSPSTRNNGPGQGAGSGADAGGRGRMGHSFGLSSLVPPPPPRWSFPSGRCQRRMGRPTAGRRQSRNCKSPQESGGEGQGEASSGPACVGGAAMYRTTVSGGDAPGLLLQGTGPAVVMKCIQKSLRSPNNRH